MLSCACDVSLNAVINIVQVDTLHSGEYMGDEVDEAEERRARRAVALSFLSNM